MGTLQTILPKEAQTLSRRLWLRGAKRLGLLAFDAEQINERAADEEEVLPPAEPAEGEGTGPTLFGASLYRPAPTISPFTPTRSTKGPRGTEGPTRGGIKLPTASCWAFGRQSFAIPERLQNAPQRAKRFRLSLIFTRPILAPTQRTAHGQAYLDFVKWEIARLITEAIPKYEVSYLIQDSADNEAWEHYDVILRSRKPELVNFLTGATADEQMALAMGSDAVLTDHYELGAAVWGHGRRSAVLGVDGSHQAHASGHFLPEWSFDRGALDQLIHPYPKGKPATPDSLEALQLTVTQELASGCRWFEA